MSTKEELNNILRSKFNSWEHPVDEANWNEMRKEISNARKAKMRMKLAVAGSALVIAAGVGIYALLNKNTGKNELTKPTSISSGVNNTNIIGSPQAITTENKTNQINAGAKIATKGSVIQSGKTNEITSNLPAESTNNKTSNGNNSNPEVNTIAPLVVTISGAHSICSGNSVTLCGKISGGKGGESYNWQPGELTGTCITVSPTSTTVYTLTVSGIGGTNTTTASVLVNASPQASFTSDIQKGCSPISIQFKDLSTVTSGRVTSWSWNFGNGNVSNAENPVYSYNNAGNYNVNLTVVSDNGCSSTLNIDNMIMVYSHPKAAFALSTQAPTSAGTSVQFKDESTDAYGINNWAWSFFDGTDNTSNLENPSHTYSDTGMHCIHLVVTNTNGCKDSATNCLAIAPIFNLYIPSAFSPNGDHKNDVFKPVGQYMTEFEMYIFNGQGVQIYHAINKGWDGTMDGTSKVCQEGTYMYKMIITDSQNKNHTKTGQVTLLK